MRGEKGQKWNIKQFILFCSFYECVDMCINVCVWERASERVRVTAMSVFKFLTTAVPQAAQKNPHGKVVASTSFHLSKKRERLNERMNERKDNKLLFSVFDRMKKPFNTRTSFSLFLVKSSTQMQTLMWQWQFMWSYQNRTTHTHLEKKTSLQILSFTSK